MKIIAIVGMPGSGKSLVSSYLRAKGFPTIRFGEIIVNEVVNRGWEVNPKNEQTVREDLRRQLGMDACVQLTLEAIRGHMAEQQTLIIDGLYSFSEYKTLNEEFGDKLIVIAIFTPKALRYQRLAARAERPLTREEAVERDYMEIERIEKGGPIAMADFTLINDGTQEKLIQEVDNLLDHC
jgi:dephospho-CoA kinase